MYAGAAGAITALSTPPVDAPQRDPRSFTLDAARAVAGALIVWCHVSTTYADPAVDRSWIAGTFGVPFYLFVALFFVVVSFAREPERSVPSYLAGRVKKLYLPFLVWTAVYAALARIKHDDPSLLWNWNYLWTGSYTHLYFLPLLLLCTTALTLLLRPALRSPAFANVSAGVLVALAFAAGFMEAPAYIEHHPLERDDLETLRNLWRAAPAAFAAMAFALHFGRNGRRIAVARSVAIVGGLVTVVCVAGQMLGKPAMLARSVSGFGWMLLACGPWRGAWLQPLAFVGRHSFGIYLAHIAFIRCANLLLERLHLTPDLTVQLGIFAFAFGASLALSALLALLPATEWIVGYEGRKVRRTLAVREPLPGALASQA